MARPDRDKTTRLREFAVATWVTAWRDVCGVGVVLAAISAYLRPALRYGTTFGTFDAVIPFTSLGAGLYNGPVHNYTDADVASQLETWNLFDWRQIHAGHFPLWNPYSLLGLPQFANFQSSVLSLPDIVSYAVPARDAFFVVVVVKLVLAGLGTYLFARLIGLGATASALAGITYALSGGFASDLSWPLTDVMAYAGWLSAFALLTYRYPGRFRYVAGLAVTTAFFVYGGFPEANVCVALFLGLAGAVVVACLAAKRHRLSAGGFGRIGAGLVGGIGLAMPLILSGTQYASGSHRQTEVSFGAVPGKALSLLVAPGYYGLPIHGSHFLIPSTNFYETVSYVGIAALILAAVAVVSLPTQPVVLGFAVGTLALVAVAYGIGSFHPLDNMLGSIGLRGIAWRRARLIIGFPVGVLAGVGLECLLGSRGRGRSPKALAGASAAALALVGGLRLLAGRGSSAPDRAVHIAALAWPAALAVACLVAAAALWAARFSERPRLRASLCGLVAGCLLAGNAWFLIAAGSMMNTWTTSFYPESPAMHALASKVGGSIVAVDDGRAKVQSLSAVGVYPELNIAYRIDEFAGHDPVLPQAWFRQLAPGQGNGGLGLLVPSVDSVAEAREYGISWLLLPPGRRAPAGADYSTTLAGERLYFVPGVNRFDLVAPGTPSTDTAAESLGSTSVSIPMAGTYVVRTDSPKPAVLIARVTEVPGWHATIDGHGAGLSAYGGVMQSLDVPAGSHTIVLSYEPQAFIDGLYVAAATFVTLLVFGVLSWRRPRQRHFGRHSGQAGVAEPEAFPDGLSLSSALAEK